MGATLSKSNILTRDALRWGALMVVLASLSFIMLAKDSRKQYGAVAFGTFPEFAAVDSQGKAFDQHRLHGQLSAVIISEGAVPADVAMFIRKLSQATALGRKFLHGLVLTNNVAGQSDQWFQYLALDAAELEGIKNWQEGKFNNGIILVDQNAVIRGVFDLEDKLQRMNFEGAVRGIL